jgi:hypothetical protein
MLKNQDGRSCRGPHKGEYKLRCDTHKQKPQKGLRRLPKFLTNIRTLLSYRRKITVHRLHVVQPLQDPEAGERPAAEQSCFGSRCPKSKFQVRYMKPKHPLNLIGISIYLTVLDVIIKRQSNIAVAVLAL